MKKPVFIILASILVLSSFQKTTADAYSLTVEVKQLRNSKGVVQFALYNKDGSIPDEHYKNYYKISKGKILDQASTITFKNIPSGRYAINILHDENQNGKIDKGFILPIEGIGFSNFQAISPLNRPNFLKASFDLVQSKKIKIKVIYL